MKSVLLSLLIATTILSLQCVSAAGMANKPVVSNRIVLGVAPFMSPMALVKRMAPLRNYLTEQLGERVNVETTHHAKDFMKRTLSGKYDFVLTNPIFALIAVKTGNFEILGGQKKQIAGHFISLKNSGINSLSDLAGKKLGAPDKVGLLGKLATPYLKSTKQFNKDNFPKVSNYNSHNASVSALRLGDVDATLIVSFMEKHLLDKGYNIQTFHKTDQLPGMAILAHKKTSPTMNSKLKQILLNLDKNEQGRAVLKKTKMPGYKEMTIADLKVLKKYFPSL